VRAVLYRAAPPPRRAAPRSSSELLRDYFLNAALLALILQLQAERNALTGMPDPFLFPETGETPGDGMGLVS